MFSHRQKTDFLMLCHTISRANGEMKPDASEDESEEENEEGDYTVYECPGLAPVGSFPLLDFPIIIIMTSPHV